MVDDTEEEGTSVDFLADSTDVKGLKVVTNSGSSEEFLNEYKYLIVEDGTGRLFLSDEDLDDEEGYSCDTHMRLTRYIAIPSVSREILYISKLTVDEDSLFLQDGSVGYKESERVSATFQKGAWSLVREI
ncbi:MAG: hypothetical protein ACOYK0_06085 [Candidatus Nanopelagicaceae bacterium]|jgi:hypothetical protein